MATKREQKENAGRTARALSLEISRGPANADLVTLIDPRDEYGWFQNFDSYGDALAFMVKAHRDRQDFGTPYPWENFKSRRPNPSSKAAKPAAKRAKNPATKLPAKSADVRGAARKYLDFTGHAPGVIGEVDIKIPKAVAVIGTCDGILYTTVRDGKTERYIHEFKAADKPAFTVTPDGRGIFLVGGRYDFTDRGIVDASDPTSPRRRRR